VNRLLDSETEDWGTPKPFVELARYTLDGIDLDPATSSYWNEHLVKARHFFDERINGLKQAWFGRVFLNAPSNREMKISVRPFWDRLIEYYAHGEVDSAIWIGFQLGQLQTLQSSAAHPLQFAVVFPKDRIDFMRRMPSGAAPQPAGSPTHANYIACLPTRRSPSAARAMLGRFVERANSLECGGALVRPLS
jgi:hypothetical protein